MPPLPMDQDVNGLEGTVDAKEEEKDERDVRQRATPYQRSDRDSVRVDLLITFSIRSAPNPSSQDWPYAYWPQHV